LAQLRDALATLRDGRVPLADLLVSQGISRELAAYYLPSPAARAAMQLLQAGKSVRPGQRVRFLYTCDQPGVWAWDRPCAGKPNIDVARYTDLFIRAVAALLQPLNWEETAVRSCLLGHAQQQALPLAWSKRDQKRVGQGRASGLDSTQLPALLPDELAHLIVGLSADVEHPVGK
jgi:DNA polymerase elongation subunit (family B)